MQAPRRRVFGRWTLGSGLYRGAPRALISLAVASAACSSGEREPAPAQSAATQLGKARQALGGTVPLFDGPVTGSGIVPADRDTTIIGVLPNLNFGASSVLRVQGSGRARALVGINPAAIAQTLQANQLLTARLVLPIVEADADFGVEQVVGVHRLRHAWGESSSTWNCASDTLPNGVADCSGDTAWAMLGSIEQVPWLDPATSTALVNGGDGGALLFDVTRDVACSLAGELALEGWLVKKGLENPGGPLDLASRESLGGPALLLEWTDENGVVVGEADCASLSTLGGATCTASGESDASCDGVDDDCDGVVDEDFVPVATSCGVGACATTGVTSCSGGVLRDSCQAGSSAEVDTTCNAVDDDCDGSTDEDYVSLSTSCGGGACSASGSTSCSGGAVTDSCQPGAPAPDDSACNGLDDDCDAVVDEDYAPVATSCGVGACSAGGATSCVLGAVVDSCSPGAPAADDASCDGSDDDCDGVADEDYVLACSGSRVLHCVAGALQGSDCSDANACNGRETCSDALCHPGAPPEQDDQNPCTADSCDPALGVVHTPIEVGTACDDFFACDGAGQCVSLLPPDPASVAPALAPGFVSLWDRMRFLFEQGDPPIQTGVVAGALKSGSAAVLRGRVLDAAGQPLRGVTVQIHGHPEYGQTLSRLDGNYDLLVNGGGSLTVELDRPGFLPVQRTLRVPAQDYSYVNDVVLSHPDEAVTELLLPAAVPQLHESSPSIDGDGERRILLHVNSGTEAQLEAPDGSVTPVPELSIRATEFTLGALGQNAMPADAPATTGYTYAVELAADGETDPAQHIEFSQPVTLLVDNFLNFPTGRSVPVAAYDRAAAAWIGEPNGRVIEVLGEQSGLAELDVDGSGQAADAAALAALGVSGEELQLLAQRFSAGSSLWRVSLSYLAPYDLNGPYTVLRGSGGADPDLPRAEVLLDQPGQAHPAGSSIELENQVLAQRLPLAGTPFTLNYRTDRVPGSAQLRSLDVPVTGASVSDTLMGGVVEVQVAGQRHVFDFPPLPNQSLSFTWDGFDREQRPLQGRQPVLVTVGAKLPARHTRPSTSAIAFGKTGNPTELLPARQPGLLTVSQSHQLQLGAPDSFDQGLGAWSISVHHSYDPVGRVLHGGDGTRRGANSIADTIERFAGVPHSTQANDAGDGGLARNATLNEARAVAVAADGAVYIGTRVGIRRVDPVTQIITSVAGGQAVGTCNPNLIDGAPANMCLFPRKLDVGPDGGLYISDNPTGGGTVDRIRRLDLQTGLVRHIAGRSPGSGCANRGDGGPARDAAICSLISHATGPDGSIYVIDRGSGASDGGVRKISPNGIIDTVFAGSWAANDDSGDIAVGPDGSLYVTGDRTLRRILPTGEERVVAGTGLSGSTGDGGPATSATFGGSGPWSVLALPDGRVLVGDNGNQVLRLIDQRGIISRFAGIGTSVPGVAGDGGAPLQGALSSGSVRPALAPDGSLYLLGRSNQTIRRIRPTLDGNFTGEQLVPSEDGREIYRFDANGRHLQTLHGLTHGLLYSFHYDAQGRLLQIVDGDGNVTSIEHGSSGAPLRITAPFGQETQLETDANGYLSKVSDPSGAETTLRYDALGLLVAKVDARGGQHAYHYDGSGRLISAEDAASGQLQLARSGSGALVSVTRSSAEGLSASFSTERLTTDVERRTRLREDGRSERLDTRRDQLQTLTQFDGTLVTSTPGPDPVWGMARPLLGAFSERLPSGSTRVASELRTAVLGTPLQPLTLLSSTQSFTLNGRTASLSYDGAALSLTSRSPRNRLSVALLDARGRVTQLSATGLLPAVYGYDGAGRLESFVQGDRSLSALYDAAGNLSALEDALGQLDVFSHDASGRMIAHARADGSVLGLEYDAAGNLTALTPPGRPAHEMTYTANDRLESYAAPDVGSGVDLTSYVYDDDDRLTQIFRPDGSSVQLAYDTAGRLAGATLPTGSITLGYFPTTGHLQTLNGPAGVNLTFQRDGALLTSTLSSGSVSGSVGNGYDVFRRVSSETVNGANSISFGYDDDGYVSSAGALTLVYEPNLPRLASTTLGQVSDLRSYDGYGELSSYSASQGGTAFFGQTLERDDAGRLQFLTETVAGATTSYEYGYDPLGQLLSVAIDGVLVREYGYDANGNRVSVDDGGGVLSASYDAQDRLTGYGDLELSYAGDGTLQAQTHLITGDVTSYGYDALGNLLSVELPDGRLIEYLVDGMGRRVAKKVDGVFVQKWLYGAGPSPVAELDGANLLVKRFAYATRTDVPDYVLQGGATYRVVLDHLGSVRRVVNVANAADVLVSASYDELGNPSGAGIGAFLFGFGGGIFDADTGLTRYGRRDYAASLGRWLSTDPLQARGADPNPYRYAGNAPLGAAAPNGRALPAPPVVGSAVFETARALARSLARPLPGRSETSVIPGLPPSGR